MVWDLVWEWVGKFIVYRFMYVCTVYVYIPFQSMSHSDTMKSTNGQKSTICFHFFIVLYYG